MKNTKGITLIALVITIVVLLILALVTIKLVLDGGIITHAQNAKNKYEEAQKNELEQLNNITSKIEKVPAELQKYVLGEDLKGQSLYNVMSVDENGLVFKELNGKEVTLIDCFIFYNFSYSTIEEDIYNFWIRYDNKAYSIKTKATSISIDETKFETLDVEFLYEPKENEGKKVVYSYDGTKENEREWLVLYDNGETMEIISPETIGNVTIGPSDETIKGDDIWIKRIDSYNNAVPKINNYSRNLVTNKNKIAVRSVGTNPREPDKDNAPMYERKEWENKEFLYDDLSGSININKRLKSSDFNDKDDLVRIVYWLSKGKINIDDFWIASRKVKINGDGNRDFYVGNKLIVPTGWSKLYPAGSIKQGVRPVVKVNTSSVKIVE